MKVLVVGAQGYLGARIADHLRKNHEVICTARKTIPGALVGNVLTPKLHEEIAKLKGLDAFVYTVSLNHSVGMGDWELAQDVGVKSTFRFLELAQKCGAQKFIYFSTQQVYGAHDSGVPLAETVKPLPTSIYGLTHFLSEEIGNFFSRQKLIKAVSFRLSNAIGAPLVNSAHVDTLVAPEMCRMAMRDGVIKLRSDGTPQRNFILISDICGAVEKVLGPTERPIPSVLNLGSTTTLTLAELAWKIKNQAEEKKKQKIEVILNNGQPLSSIEPFAAMKKYQYPIDELTKLGISPNPNIDLGISELLDYYQR